jgi:hypothetical protein
VQVGTAVSARDGATLSRIFPRYTEKLGDLNARRALFRDYTFTIDGCSTGAVTGTSAKVGCGIVLALVPIQGDPSIERGQLTVTFRHALGGWVVDALTVR